MESIKNKTDIKVNKMIVNWIIFPNFLIILLVILPIADEFILICAARIQNNQIDQLVKGTKHWLLSQAKLINLTNDKCLCHCACHSQLNYFQQ